MRILKRFNACSIILVIFFFIFTFLILTYTNTNLHVSDLKKTDIKFKSFNVEQNSVSALIKNNKLIINKVNNREAEDKIKNNGNVFYRLIKLENEELFLKFVIKNKNVANQNTPKFLHVDLHGENFDKDENQINIELTHSVQGVATKLYVGKNHLKEMHLRFFTHDNVDLEISKLEVWTYKASSRVLQNICFSLLIAAVAFLILKSNNTKSYKLVFLVSLFVVITSIGVFLNYLNNSLKIITGDEAVYISQAYSFLYDMNNLYEKKDLVRFYLAGFNRGPVGLFLNYYNNNFYFSKTILYGLVGVPFVWLFGANGLEILNLICLYGLIYLSHAFLSRKNHKVLSYIFSLLFISLSVLWGYIFECFIDIFNVFMLGLSLFVFTKYIQGSRDKKYLILSAFLFGIIGYSRSPFLSFAFFCFLKLLFDNFYKKESFKNILIFTGILIVSFLIPTFYHISEIGSFSPYGGTRYYFRGLFPYIQVYNDEEITQENIFTLIKYIKTGTSSIVSKSIIAIKDYKAFLYNIFYFLVGRQTGALIYFPCLFLVFFNLRYRDVKENWYILFGILGHILFFMLQGYDNYYGGAQSLGNRYLLQILVAFLFLVPVISLKRTICGSLFAFLIFFYFLFTPMNQALIKRCLVV